MNRADDLERLLDEARESSPAERLPMYRDAIAAFGEEAIEPLATWIGEPVFAAFAIRTLGRIAALDQGARDAVATALVTTDRSAMPDHIARDLDAALEQLGLSPARRAAAARARAGGPRAMSARPVQNPGVDGRGYWAMRTSPWERPYIWAEAQRGRLRQGWGWAAEQNLEVIALAVRAGKPLSDEQQMAWPSRRMMSSEPDGMRADDLVLVPNIPEWGLVCVFRLVGSYGFAPDAPRRFDDRFGHILPVELVAGPISRYDRTVSDALQSSMRNPGRLWSIVPYGGDVERLVSTP
ncbi:MAG: hypothetical protein ACSLFN_02760 [Candidatus Limnocylindrales bacterium]